MASSAPIAPGNLKFTTIALTLTLTLQLAAHLGTFVLLALELFFRLALMALDFGRVMT
jgi:hypothetical protein